MSSSDENLCLHLAHVILSHVFWMTNSGMLSPKRQSTSVTVKRRKLLRKIGFETENVNLFQFEKYHLFEWHPHFPWQLAALHLINSSEWYLKWCSMTGPPFTADGMDCMMFDVLPFQQSGNDAMKCFVSVLFASSNEGKKNLANVSAGESRLSIKHVFPSAFYCFVFATEFGVKTFVRF